MSEKKPFAAESRQAGESHDLLTLSIVIPVYNEENHLRACLDSIAAQVIKPEEVIVVDNNSTDNTVKIAKSYAFVRILSEKKQGVVFARDKGFNAAKSDLIGRIDADTILPASWVADIMKFYKNRDALSQCLSGGAYFYNIRSGHFVGWVQGQVAFRVNRTLLGHYILFGSNMVIPKNLWRAARGQTCDDTNVHEDLDLAIHLHRLGYQIVFQGTLKVGVKMRRVTEDRERLWQNLMLWPETLKRHKLSTWVFGWVGAALLYVLSFMFPFFKKKTRIKL